MTVIIAILLGIIQGITEFIPASSAGHMDVITNAIGLEQFTGLSFNSVLHFGTLLAVIIYYQKDIGKILVSGIGILLDLIGNANLYLHNRRTEEELKYARIISDTYRKLTVMLFVTMIPTILIGMSARRLAEMTAVSQIGPGIGMLLTAVLLIVTDLSAAGRRKTIQTAGYDTALWIGIAQGLSVFPGVSRMALTICFGLFCGLNRKTAVKYSVLAGAFASLGAFLEEFRFTIGAGLSGSTIAAYILGMIAAAVTGYFLINLLLKITNQIKLRYFAFYCFMMGAVFLIATL